MRTLVIATAGLAMTAAGGADAQRIVQHGPGAGYGVPGRVPGATPMTRPMPTGPMVRPVPGRPGFNHGGNRWGSKIGGRWWGGVNAPGGWGGYRRPYRGWALPGYWNAPRFYISDWSGYGLAQPPVGYTWTRYYDDAVLIDGRGSVYDTVGGLNWDQLDGAGFAGADYADNGDYYAGDDRVYAGPGERGGYAYDDRGQAYRGPGRDNGVGGAVIGGVVGGVAGNVIAGRGNRLGGTLIGAGVGAAAGYAIDRAEDRGRGAPPPPPRGYAPGYGAGYAAPSYPAPAYAHAPGGSWVSADGSTTVTTTSGYGGGSTTTVVVQPAPVVTTTTTTEYYEDAVTYSRPHKKVWKKRWRPAPACRCR